MGGDPLKEVDPFGLSPSDVDKILWQFEKTVRRMTQDGVRSDNWIINNSLLGRYICSDQSTEVLTDVRTLASKLPKLDDKWKFDFKDNFETKQWWQPRHVWVEGTSNNPQDPVITLDAWKHKSVLRYYP